MSNRSKYASFLSWFLWSAFGKWKRGNRVKPTLSGRALMDSPVWRTRLRVMQDAVEVNR